MAASTISGGGLKFDIVADPSQFNSAVAEADAKWKGATQSMQGASASWSDEFVRVTDRIGSVIGSVTSLMQEAFSGGADGAEKATLAAFEKIKASTEGMLDQIGSLVERWGGKLGKRVGDAIGSIAKEAIDPASKALTDGLDKVVSDERFTGVIDKTKEWASSLDQATGAAGKLEERLSGVVSGFQNAVKVAKGERLGVDTFNAIVESLDKQIERHERATQLIGKSADAVVRLRSEWALVDAGIDPEKMAPDQKAKYEEKLGDAGAAAQTEKDANAAVRQAEAYRHITVEMQRQIDLATAKTREEGRSISAITEEKTLFEAAARMRQKGRELTEAELQTVAQLATEMGYVTEEAAKQNFLRQSSVNAQRAVRNSELEMATYGLQPGKLAEARAFANELQRAREQNIELSAEMKDKMMANARSIGEAAQAAADFKERMAQIKETGAVVTKSLESAFSSFIQGNKVSWRQMVADMIADLAKLTLRQNVLQPLFGGGSTPGAGLLGNALGSLFQARAGGGPVSSGVPYIVGEKRPELFVPQSAGTIVPQVPGGGSVTNTQLAVSIDARGATPDAVRLLEARMPQIILETVGDARQRGILA